MRNCILIGMLLVTATAFSQVTYYKGEWTVADKADLFTCICKIDIQKDGFVLAEFVWTYKAIDSTNEDLMITYKDKKGNKGVEFTQGIYYFTTGDIKLQTTKLADPYSILGTTKYYLKISADKQVVYGISTTPEGTDPGLFYAIKTMTAGKEFNLQKASIK